MSCKQISHYLIGKTLGEGSQGKVVLAYHELAKEKVALNILNKYTLFQSNNQARIEIQLRILRKLRHPNIIQMYEILESKSSIYIVLELALNGSLQQYSGNRIPENRAIYYFSQLLDSVEYLHQNNIAHLDIKPSNVLLSTDVVKLSNFEYSNFIDNQVIFNSSEGSPLCKAPEMLANKPYDSVKCDIWSCGVILYLLLQGCLPFEESNKLHQYKQISRQQLIMHYPINFRLHELITKMLDKKPDNRISISGIRKYLDYGSWQVPKFQKPENQLQINILLKLEALGFSQEDIIQSIEKNKHNQFSALYYIIQNKQKQEQQQVKLYQIEEESHSLLKSRLLEKLHQTLQLSPIRFALEGKNTTIPRKGRVQIKIKSQNDTNQYQSMSISQLKCNTSIESIQQQCQYSRSQSVQKQRISTGDSTKQIHILCGNFIDQQVKLNEKIINVKRKSKGKMFTIYYNRPARKTNQGGKE